VNCSPFWTGSNKTWAGWACDGDDHWTTELVRDWWGDRARLDEWIDRKLTEWAASENEQENEVLGGLRDYAPYVAGDLELTLRRYCFWLNERRSPVADELLPELQRAHRGWQRL
jgi:hypothetical protein